LFLDDGKGVLGGLSVYLTCVFMMAELSR
jgi:hypothetical protein